MDHSSWITDRVRFLLPRELRLSIYAFAFSVDTDFLKILGSTRDYVWKHELPPLRACKDLESYVNHRKLEKEKYNHYFDPLPEPWPDDVEYAFFTDSIENTIRAFPQTLTPLELLAGRAKSRVARLLQARGIQLTEKRQRNEVISDIILGFTGQVRTRRQVSSHLQSLKRVLRVPLQANFGTSHDWISDLVSFTQDEPYTMHDFIYHFLHDGILEVDNELGILESVFMKALGPAYRCAVRKILILALEDDLKKLTEILHHDNFPCLRWLTVRIYDQSGLYDPPLSAEAKEGFVKVLKTANPEAEVKLFLEMDINPEWASDVSNRSAHDEVIQELKQRRLGASVVSALSGLDIDSEDEESGLGGEEAILNWIRGVPPKDGGD